MIDEAERLDAVKAEAHRVTASAERQIRLLSVAATQAERVRVRVAAEEEALDHAWAQMATEVVRLLKIVQWARRVSPAFPLGLLALSAWGIGELLPMGWVRGLLVVLALVATALASLIFMWGAYEQAQRS